MKNLLKILVLAMLVVTLALAASACGKNNDDNNNNSAGAPSAPKNLALEQLTDENGKVKFSWEAPENKGTSAIVKYEVMYYVSSGGGSDMGTWLSAETNLEYTFTGCGSAHTVTFYVRAVNASGKGEEATKQLSLYYVIPNAPTMNSVSHVGNVSGNCKLTITWKYSDQFLDERFPITKFQVLVYNRKGTAYTAELSWRDAGLEFNMIQELKLYTVDINVSSNQDGWKVEVRACNANGAGAVSDSKPCDKQNFS